MRYVVNSPQVTHDTIDGEAIIVHLVTGRYYSLREAGAPIWNAVCRGASPEETVERLKAAYDGDPAAMRAAVDALTSELAGQDLLRVVPDAAALPAEPAPSSRQPFSAPKLSVYTDMQELLVLDPIHDVDEAGWPKPKP